MLSLVTDVIHCLKIRRDGLFSRSKKGTDILQSTRLKRPSQHRIKLLYGAKICSCCYADTLLRQLLALAGLHLHRSALPRPGMEQKRSGCTSANWVMSACMMVVATSDSSSTFGIDVLLPEYVLRVITQTSAYPCFQTRDVCHDLTLAECNCRLRKLVADPGIW